MATGRIPCGIAIPQTFPSGTIDMQLIREFAQKAEQHGYEGLWTMEQIVSPAPILEPLSLLTYLSAVTSRIRLGVSVMLTVLRNPVQLAKLISSMDQMSQGRIAVGVGIGGHIPESIFGLSSEQRSRRFVEGINVMKALWTQPQATVDGQFWKFEKIGMEPKPVQKPHPPIWFGARVPVALKRAVRHGDAWMGAGSSSSEDFFQQSATTRQLLADAGRDPATFTFSKRVYVAIDNDRDRAERRLREWFAMYYRNADMGSRVSIWGSRQECFDKLAALVQAGAQHLMLNPVFDQMEHLQILAEDIVPRL
jgi:probable F420-dependent oxidoreductase